MLIPAIRAIFVPVFARQSAQFYLLKCVKSTSSERSALALFVTRIGTDHAHDAVALDDFAVATHLLD
jgi:hypothetical protein